ncbi:hypothetical protein VNI00_012217 [Paramarasmius palmivorus]|uniref:Xylanolytic transcriptional activator regulatory domain-containing protein n=1 Tax=Paramarasmius palmivorus TaxID=297713 RepID=A0AAW0C6Q2_9AGAR
MISRAKVALSSQSNAEADSLRRYIRKLAKANQEDRETLLAKWIQDDEKKLALGRRIAPRAVSDQEEEEEEEEPFPASSSARPNKRSRGESHISETHSTPKSLSSVQETDSEPEDTESDAITRTESALRLSLKPEEPPPSEVSSASDLDEKERNTQMQSVPFVPNREVSAWIDYYIQNTFPSGLAAEGPTLGERQILLDNYFSFVNPLSAALYSSSLFTDGKAHSSSASSAYSSTDALETNDPKYFTPFLLWSVYSHTARHIPQLAANVFQYAAKAHILLAADLSRPSSIPTIQGLILLSANNAARGMYAQAWHMTASAISMIIDLGIHLDKEPPDDRASASPASGSGSDRTRGGKRGRSYVARQMRLRVYWAAFVWDKLISLALNRTPLLSGDERRPPLPDPVEDNTMWTPYIAGECPPSLLSYQPQPRHQHRCFYENIRANEFLDEVHRYLYRKPWRRLPSHQVRDFVSNMRDRMLEWQRHADRQIVLQVTLDSLRGEGSPPPPHILQLNILVRVIWILLYRPFYYTSASALAAMASTSSPTTKNPSPHIGRRHSSSPKTNHVPHPSANTNTSDDLLLVPHAVSTCEQAAVEIHILFRWYAEAFPLGRASYAVIFAAFLAATIDLALADRQQGLTLEMSERLELCGVVLKGGQGSVPGMQSSMEKLSKHLERVLEKWARGNDVSPGLGPSHVQAGLGTPEQKVGVAGIPVDDGYTRRTSDMMPAPALVPAYANTPLSATPSLSSDLTGSTQNLHHTGQDGYHYATTLSIPTTTMATVAAHPAYSRLPTITIPHASLDFRDRKYQVKPQMPRSDVIASPSAPYQAEHYSERYHTSSVPHGRGEVLEAGHRRHSDVYQRQDHVDYTMLRSGQAGYPASHITSPQLPVGPGAGGQTHAYTSSSVASPQGYQYDSGVYSAVRDVNMGHAEWNAWFWPGENASLGGG